MAASATVLQFSRVRKHAGDWTQQELSEFYRVEGALLQAGLRVVTDRGVSDEGDPWFVFCREEDSSDVIAHFARIDYQYVVVSSLFSGVARGPNFRLLVEELLNLHAQMLHQKIGQVQNVFLHPTTLLVMLVAMSFLASSEKSFADHTTSPESFDKGSDRSASFMEAVLLSAIAITDTWIESHLDTASKILRDGSDAILPDTNGASGVPAHVVASVDLVSLDTAFPILHSDRGLLPTRADFQAVERDGSGDVDAPGLAVRPGSMISSIEHNRDAAAESTSSSISNIGHDSSSLSDNDIVQLAQSLFLEGDSNLALSTAVATPAVSNHLLSIGSGFGIANDALGAVVSDVGIATMSVPSIVLSANNDLSLDSAILEAMSHLGPMPRFGSSAVSSGTTMSSSVPDSSLATATPSAIVVNPIPQVPQNFNSLADTVLQDFVHATAHFEVDIVGKNIVVIDTDVSHITNSNFGLQSWNMADGSTLTIVGIIPHLAHAMG
jgi:hypothetical protein